MHPKAYTFLDIEIHANFMGSLDYLDVREIFYHEK